VNVPEQLSYTAEHEWVRDEEGLFRIGITDYAQDALGDIVFVSLPEVGSELHQGGTFGEVESTKSVSDVYAPVSGTVTAVNAELANDPSLLNSDPYGAGWICEITVDGTVDTTQLMSAAEYSALIGS